MIGMQYRVSLPNDYNMDIIRTRVKENGSKTDGFKDLLCKCYLIQESGIDGFENVYAPLYIWKESAGMNEFLFNGYYDNIIKSFGWKQINLGIPLTLDLKENFKEANYVIEFIGEITPRISLKGFTHQVEKPEEDEKNNLGYALIYNPDQWKYSQFIFYKSRPALHGDNLYQILHISEGT